MPEKIAIAGTGRMARALGRLLRESGQPVVAVAGRTRENTAAAVRFIGHVAAVDYRELPGWASRILIAVSDDAVNEVAAILADAGMRQGAAVHTCGAFGPEALSPLAARGVSCAAFHPLQSIASAAQGLSALRGAAFAVTGEGPAAAWAEEMAGCLDGRILRVPAEHRALYHAAAVMASNYVVGLIDAAVLLMGAAGIPQQEALAALAPLVRTSAANALTLGPAGALTGPVERGDTRTVSHHLETLDAASAPLCRLYRALGMHVLALARRKGAAENHEEMEALLCGQQAAK